MQLTRTISSPQPPEAVYAYLADFTRTEEWDPGTIRTTRVSGTGGVGTRYHNLSRFLGRQTELTYVVEEASPPTRLQLRGENKTVVATDTMTLTPNDSGGTEVTYRADFRFRGVARLVAPLLAPALRRLGDGAEKRLHEVLR